MQLEGFAGSVACIRWLSCLSRFRPIKRTISLLILLACASANAQVTVTVDYDIVYVRQPRYGDENNTIWPEIFHPARAEPGADLVLLRPDGSEEVLVQGGSIGTR